MAYGDAGWQLFASTGKISDYLKYREDTDTRETQEKEQYERDLYGDRYGFVDDADRGI